jgi:uncharacterized protein (TIGR00288 family)
MTQDRHLLGVFIDFENLALGFRDPQHERFEIKRVLARLVEKGNIVVKRAYADWKRFPRAAGELQEAAFELLQIPARRLGGKNSADMRLCVDVIDVCYSKPHIDTHVVVSGDSDFSPLVSKLKENGRTVIGLGMRDSTSSLLRDNCDEFIYYEDLEVEEEQEEKQLDVETSSDKERDAYRLLLDALAALRRENRDVYWASLIKETIKRKKPSFNEPYYGFKSFTKLLQSAEAKGLVTLGQDAARRSHYVTAFGDELRSSGQGNSRGSSRSRRRRPSKADEGVRSEDRDRD